MSVCLLLVLFASLLAVALSQLSDVYATNYGGFAGPSSWSNQPPPREGTVYGNNPASQYIYFAGGVELISATTPNLVYTDVWAIDYANRQFVQASVSLPSGSYFGVGGWGLQTNSLWIHNGRNNTGDGNNTYWTGLVQLAYTAASPTTPTLTNVALSMAVDGREYASSLIFVPKGGVETMFVYGGLSGVGGYTTPTINFYSIALQGSTVGRVTVLNQTSSYMPYTASATAVTSNPTMFVNPSTFDHVYFYGGLDGSGDVFADASKVFIYQISTAQWLAPTSPAHSSFSAVSFNPYIVYSGTIITADFTHVLLLGGDYGLGSTGDSEVNGTHSNVFHIDVTPLMSNPLGQPYLAQLKYSLPYRVESPVSALVGNTTIVSWSGSQYINEEQNDAAAYVSGTVYATYTAGQSGSTQTVASLCSVLSLAVIAVVALLM